MINLFETFRFILIWWENVCVLSSSVLLNIEFCVGGLKASVCLYSVNDVPLKLPIFDSGIETLFKNHHNFHSNKQGRHNKIIKLTNLVEKKKLKKIKKKFHLHFYFYLKMNSLEKKLWAKNLVKKWKEKKRVQKHLQEIYEKTLNFDFWIFSSKMNNLESSFFCWTTHDNFICLKI
jgi:hypothetical protein